MASYAHTNPLRHTCRLWGHIGLFSDGASLKKKKEKKRRQNHIRGMEMAQKRAGCCRFSLRCRLPKFPIRVACWVNVHIWYMILLLFYCRYLLISSSWRVHSVHPMTQFTDAFLSEKENQKALVQSQKWIENETKVLHNLSFKWLH